MRFTGDYSSTHRLTDGTPVRLRLLRRADRKKLVAAFDRLSPESRYRRFFTAMPRLPDKLLRRLLDTDGWNHVAIGAETMTEDPAEGEGVGIARFIRLKDQPTVAEAAVTVVDHMQRRGLGKLLVSALAAAARER
ncbi:MAG TPA: GNAT family N-acetyltransferase, partial [Verrucomicrobiae bacterium]|nr:GNAT family N-acetyltransferase [Verrucomicrobiae bacterium]